MAPNYTVAFDAEKKQYFVQLSAHDKLWIVPPPWFSMKWQPDYIYRGESVALSPKQEAPTEIKLSTEEVVQLCQQSWKPFADVLPTLMINGATTILENKLKWFDRVVALTPLLLFLPSGLHGVFCGCIALGLNLAVLRTMWPGWQKTLSMLATTSAAAMIYFSGLLTLEMTAPQNASALPPPVMYEVREVKQVGDAQQVEHVSNRSASHAIQFGH